MPKKYLISGGGTGGHIFPALSIANELRRQDPECEILFVGAKGRMEMEKIPAAGYTIVGLWISGLQRKTSPKNLSFPFKLVSSLLKAFRIVRKFNPDCVIGTGGYASGPTLYAASVLGYPTLIQEQNSYPGITNKLLSKKALSICVAYEGLDRWFPAKRIRLTGNPVRAEILEKLGDNAEAKRSLGFDPDKPLVLSLGGSLGARAINEALKTVVPASLSKDVQWIWQCGGLYIKELVETVEKNEGLLLTDFINDMPQAYSAADLIIARAGAGTISELCLVGKPSILIPSPNVAEDHQTHNARSISDKHAAVLLEEKEIDGLGGQLERLIADANARETLASNLIQLARPNATKDIVEEIKRLER
jgi:UDP-N-acetylglucosamine--N-acetylmuramyl-(pentapeptide) pyrophosphoryl-undecaprenol N-acetylglucosamine transferase